MSLTLCLKLCLSLSLGSAAHASPSVGGDLKLFHNTSGAPRGLGELMKGSAGGAMTSRFKLWGALDDEGRLTYEAHALLTSSGGSAALGAISLNPNASAAPEALPLSLDLSGDPARLLLLRADRLWLGWEGGQARVVLGRQALSLGQGRAFTPLDRVTPLSPASIDREYKPGVDALSASLFWGVAGQLTLIAAYGEAWSVEGSTFAVSARDSFWGWDLSLTSLSVRGDRVLGGSVSGALGPLSAFGDLAWTWANEQLQDEQGFWRASGGIDYSWAEGGGGLVSLELSWQGDGARSGEYLLESQDPRVLRQERWLLGRAYATLSLSQSLTPLLTSGLSVISNLQDPSALIGPSLSWSVSQDVSASVSAFMGAGELPSIQGLSAALPSEFGALSWVGVAMLSAVF